MLSCWALYRRGGTNQTSLWLFSSGLWLPPSLLLSCSPDVCFVFPVRLSRSSLCHSWSPRITERGSSPLFPLGHFCPTFLPSKSAFPQCSSTKSTSGHLAPRCPRPQALSGKERPTDIHNDLNIRRCTFINGKPVPKYTHYIKTVPIKQESVVLLKVFGGCFL